MEYDIDVGDPGEYRVWVRIMQHQDTETKTVFVDGNQLGQVQSTPRDGGGLVFHAIGRTVRLSPGEHVLRLVAGGIKGYVDPINWIYMTTDLKVDPNAGQYVRADTPVRPGDPKPALDAREAGLKAPIFPEQYYARSRECRHIFTSVR